jgi:membrane protease YdiL (CAAX protease family)
MASVGRRTDGSRSQLVIMHIAAACLATALVIWTVIISPVAIQRIARYLRSHTPNASIARQRGYTVSIVVAWLTTGIIALVGLLSDRSAASIGLTIRNLHREAVTIGLAFVAGAVILTTIGTGYMRHSLTRSAESRRLARNLVGTLPQTGRERLLYAGMGISAGVCEEIVFRGFGITYIRWLIPDASRLFIIVIIAIAFGFVHHPQGRQTVQYNTVMGGVFAWVTLSTGTLVPAMIVHALIDLRNLALPSALVDSSQSGSGASHPSPARSPVSDPQPPSPVMGTLSEDRSKFWSGTRWVPTTSADGRRWNGTHWVESPGDGNTLL